MIISFIRLKFFTKLEMIILLLYMLLKALLVSL